MSRSPAPPSARRGVLPSHKSNHRRALRIIRRGRSRSEWRRRVRGADAARGGAGAVEILDCLAGEKAEFKSYSTPANQRAARGR